MKYKTQSFNAVANRACSSLLFLSAIGIIVPTAAKHMAHKGAMSDEWVLNVSRVTAVVLLLIYFCYLAFQLVTHKSMFNGEEGGRACLPAHTPWLVEVQQDVPHRCRCLHSAARESMFGTPLPAAVPGAALLSILPHQRTALPAALPVSCNAPTASRFCTLATY